MSKIVTASHMVALRSDDKTLWQEQLDNGYFGPLFKESRQISGSYRDLLNRSKSYCELPSTESPTPVWNDGINEKESKRLLSELSDICHAATGLSSKIQTFIQVEVTKDGLLRKQQKADLDDELKAAWKKLWNRVARWSVASLVIILGYSAVVYIAEKNYFGGFIKIPALHTIEKITGS